MSSRTGGRTDNPASTVSKDEENIVKKKSGKQTSLTKLEQMLRDLESRMELKLLDIEKKCTAKMRKQEDHIKKSLDEMEKIIKHQETTVQDTLINNMKKEISKSINEVNKQMKDAIEDLQVNMKQQIDDLNKSNNFVFNTLSDKVDNLESNTLPKTRQTKNKDMTHYIPKSIRAYESIEENFISDRITDELNEFLKETQFIREGNRHTRYYGEFAYTYSGKTHEASTPPKVVTNLIDTINKKAGTEKHKINSCLITLYESEKDSLPLHSDNEECIHPESFIYTLSIGDSRVMEINSIMGGKDGMESIELNNRSLLCMSRTSQEIFQHSIPTATKRTERRYSLTFRCVAPYNKNSTLIIGDSNTEKLLFNEHGFGKWMPGKRIPCMLAENIPDPEEITPHKNIFIHTGINNIKYKDIHSVKETINVLKERTQRIANCFTSSNVFICPILPSKDLAKRNKIMELNMGITNIARNSENILLMPNYYSNFAEDDGLMKNAVGRWRDGQPSTDDIHIGRQGICLLARCLKHVACNRKGPITRYYQSRKESTNLYRQNYGASKPERLLLPSPSISHNHDRANKFNGDYKRGLSYNDFHRN